MPILAEPSAKPRSLSAAEYREAMSRLGAAVSVITTDGPAGPSGFTASAVCSVTDSPPTLLVCLNRNASASPSVHANGVICVNVLSDDQLEIATLFGGKTPMAERFAVGTWARAETGALRSEGALVAFDCRIERVVDVGTHAVLFCEVVAVHLGRGGRALLYFGRAYHGLGETGLDR